MFPGSKFQIRILLLGIHFSCFCLLRHISETAGSRLFVRPSIHPFFNALHELSTNYTQGFVLDGRYKSL